MAAVRTAAACPKAENGTAEPDASDDRQRDFVDSENRRAVARFAGAVWEMANGSEPLLPLAEKRGLGPGLCSVTAPQRPRWAI